MTKIKFLFAAFIFPFVINAQNLDSLFNSFVELKTGKYKEHNQVQLETAEKCAFGLVNSVRENLSLFSKYQQDVIQSLLTRPECDTSFLSPKGYFRIHYDLIGYGVPEYDLNEFAVSADSAYEREVFNLGYPAPPNDGDGVYDVYLQNLGGGLYGYTESETGLGNGKYTTYIVMDNDFGTGYASHGIYGAKVTIAHEFHHAIQMGNYIYRSEDIFYFEITSTAMEEFNFDYINDYYAYMPAYFNNPGNAFPLNNGYNLALWNIYLKDRFGFGILKRVWELMPANRAMYANALAIMEYGSTFQYEIANFGVWTYFTNYRAKDGEYFEEAVDYPLIKPVTKIEFQPPLKTVSIGNIKPASNIFIVFPDFSNGFSDTLVSIISNCDLKSSVENPNSSISAVYSLSSNYETGANKINDYYYSIIESDYKDILYERNIFNNSVNPGDLTRNEIDFAYPQPFNYSKHGTISIPSPASTEQNAELSIFTSSMKLVYNSSLPIFSLGNIVVQWNAMDNSGNKLPTGIYIYAVKAGDEIKKGKIFILNE